MIKYKSERELGIMREAGQVVAGTLRLVSELVRPDITTEEIDREVVNYLHNNNSESAFKGYRGYPANICVSVNEEVVHGIPNKRKLKNGDIVSIDIGARYKNYYGDAALTLPVGKVSKEAQRLMETTKKSLDLAITKMAPNVRLSTISKTIQDFVEAQGYSVVRTLVGHGIGQDMHEDPQVPNYVTENEDNSEVILKPGLVIAIEPMVNEGTYQVATLKNGWTVVTKDGKLSAHFEHTVAVTQDGAEVLTQYNNS
jgi:methionyl aminopeptidase